MRGNVMGTMDGQWRLQQHMHRQCTATRSIDSRNGCIDTRHGLHFGQHDVGRLSRTDHCGTPDDSLCILPKGRVIDRVEPHAYATASIRTVQQLGHQHSVLGLGTHGSAIFAIERDVKNARTEFVIQLTLQREAFAHPRLDTTVVVTHREQAA